MRKSQLKRLRELRSEAARLEREWNEARRALLALPHKLGYQSVDELVFFLNQAKAGESFATQREPIAGAERKARKKRRTITSEIKQSVARLAASGLTGAAIAKQLDVSIPSVQKIKAALGIVRIRSR